LSTTAGRADTSPPVVKVHFTASRFTFFNAGVFVLAVFDGFCPNMAHAPDWALAGGVATNISTGKTVPSVAVVLRQQRKARCDRFCPAIWIMDGLLWRSRLFELEGP
jgi:hypothetical protein